LNLRELLERIAAGDMAVDDAEKQLSSWGFVALGHQRIDTHRGNRTGTPEVVLGGSKSVEQLSEIIAWYSEHELPLLVTRIDEKKSAELCGSFPELHSHSASKTLRRGRSAASVPGRVAVVSAGSSDRSVAEEALATLDFFAIESERADDCGVAGLHRLFASGESIASCDVIIGLAGMEGALPSVLAGLFDAPVIAVPTSIGYGASFDGLAALLAMMNSCAAGVTVVNIDNGFGAAVAAASILRVAARGPKVPRA
jgi:pyridinium-3,5-biscarboxylic acid mononucleotide synthase